MKRLLATAHGKNLFMGIRGSILPPAAANYRQWHPDVHSFLFSASQKEDVSLNLIGDDMQDILRLGQTYPLIRFDQVVVGEEEASLPRQEPFSIFHHDLEFLKKVERQKDLDAVTFHAPLCFRAWNFRPWATNTIGK